MTEAVRSSRSDFSANPDVLVAYAIKTALMPFCLCNDSAFACHCHCSVRPCRSRSGTSDVVLSSWLTWHKNIHVHRPFMNPGLFPGI